MFTALVASAAHLLCVTNGLQGITFPSIVLVNVQRVNLSVILAPVLYCLPYPLLPLLNCILLTVFPLNPISSLFLVPRAFSLKCSICLIYSILCSSLPGYQNTKIFFRDTKDMFHVPSEVPEKIWRSVLALVHLLCSNLAESSHRVSSL